jgi:hypothetical protein
MTFEVPIARFDRDGEEWVAEASEIGLKPGEWPSEITMVAEDRRRVFSRAHLEERGGDLMAVHYRERGGNGLLTVLND